ncbi:MAG: L,D-transpeptidase family protein [Bdellovibrio sp.]|nr:L,D-transpeptidase family protein [Bdellovibrio sp.]
MNYKAWLKKSFIYGLSVTMLAPSFAHADFSGLRLKEVLEREGREYMIKPGFADFILHSPALRKFYEARQYQLVWIDSQSGYPNAMAQALKDMLLKADRQGLQPGDYWDEMLEKGFTKVDPAKGNWVTFELMATEALIRYSRHLYEGRVDPRSIDDDIKYAGNNLSDREFNIIVNAVAAGPAGMNQRLDVLAPQIPRYQDLKALLEYFRNLQAQNDWAQIAPAGVTLQLGVTSPTVGLLRKRFNQLGYQVTMVGNTFDQEFDTVLRSFQSQNGLTVDGSIGANRSAVLNSLNTKLSTRISQIEATMEKLRWLPRNFESRHIFVNLATSEFRLVDPSGQVFYFKTVNGQKFRQTPSMRDVLKQVIFNPTWTVPDTLAIKDKLPMLRTDPNYLVNHNMFLFENGQLVDSPKVPWSSVSPEKFSARNKDRYVIVQGPGMDNALGVVKFPLEINTQAIYMHDTNERNLFAENDRHKSSGCVRLEKPLELAAYLLQDQSKWSLPAIQSFVPMKAGDKPGKTVSVPVTLDKNGVPVYFIYLTVERGANGAIRFIDDTYGQDARVNKAVRMVNEEIMDPATMPAPYGVGRLSVVGTPGSRQTFSKVRAIRCEISKPGTCDKPLSLDLNKVNNIPAGTYLVGFENSMYPNWVNVAAGQTTTLQLQTIQVPAGMEGSRVRVFRDFSQPQEQQKMQMEMFYLKRHFYRLSQENFGDLYVAGMWERDYMQRFTYETCKIIDDLDTKDDLALRVCDDWKRATNPSGIASMFEYQGDGTFNELWVTYPGNVVRLRHPRYLVSGFMKAGDTLAVFPGSYRIQDKVGVKNFNATTVTIP